MESTILVDEVVGIDQNNSPLIMQGKEESTSKVRKMEEVKGENRDEESNSRYSSSPCSETFLPAQRPRGLEETPRIEKHVANGEYCGVQLEKG